MRKIIHRLLLFSKLNFNYYQQVTSTTHSLCLPGTDSLAGKHPQVQRRRCLYIPSSVSASFGQNVTEILLLGKVHSLECTPGCSINSSHPHANSQFSNSLLKLESGYSTWLLTTLSKTTIAKTGPEREVILREQHGRHFADLGFGSRAVSFLLRRTDKLSAQ